MSKDILTLAREAGGYRSAKYPDEWRMDDDDLERFAELVRNDYSTTHANLWLDRIHKFMLEEREACAKLVDHILKEGGGTWGDAIRARGETK